MVDQKTLKELLHYDPETGLFTWLKRDRSQFKSDRAWNARNAHYAGNVAGCDNGRGYIVIKVFGRLYKAHRLAFLYMTGELPLADTDHINGVKGDNRWVNIRSVDHAENGKNQRRYASNTSGVMGVGWHKGSKKWQVRINTAMNEKHLGSFTDKFEAICCRKSAENKHGYHDNHGTLKNATAIVQAEVAGSSSVVWLLPTTV